VTTFNIVRAAYDHRCFKCSREIEQGSWAIIELSSYGSIHLHSSGWAKDNLDFIKALLEGLEYATPLVQS